MNHRIPRGGLIVSCVCVVLAAATFLFLNHAFRGPEGVRLTHPFTLHATFADTEVLQPKFNVVVRGVRVGKVIKVTTNPGRRTARIDFTVDRSKVAVHSGATVKIGEFSILGDPYLELRPGTAGAATLTDGAHVKAQPSVNFDQSLSFLDAEGRTHTRHVLNELAAATAVPRGGEKLNATIGAVAQIVPELRDITGALRGQEDDLAGLVQDSATVLDALGQREAAIRRLVGSGRTTLTALAEDRASLTGGIRQVPGMLSAARRLLDGTHPVLRQARPIIRAVRRDAPDLTAAVSDLPRFSADLVTIVGGLSKIPSLRALLTLERRLRPLLPGLEGAVRNLVPTLRYAGARGNAIAAFFSNLSAGLSKGDSDGAWGRVYFDFEPGEFLGAPTPNDCASKTPATGVCHNAYPAAGDAVANAPYVKGSYPRLKPYSP